MRNRRRRAGAADSRTFWATAIAGALLFLVLIAGVRQFSEVQASLDRQALLASAAFAQRDRLLQFVNEESGVRAYVATGDANYLQIYLASRRQRLADAAAVARTQFAIPRLQERVRQSLPAADEVQRYFDSEIALVRAHRTQEAKRRLAEGKVLFDRLRSVDAAVQADADAELAAQRAHTRVLARAGETASVLLCGIVAVWALGFAVLLRRASTYKLTSLRDSLTGVQNRRGALAAIDAEVGAAHPDEFGLIFIDLDGFKKINDVYGHATGDAILQGVASRLEGDLRERDSVCRLGGDEFVCVIAAPASIDEVRDIAQRLRRSIGQPYELHGDSFVVGCSIGVSMYPRHGKTAEILLARADSAMYAAKAAGGGVREASAAAQW